MLILVLSELLLQHMLLLDYEIKNTLFYLHSINYNNKLHFYNVFNKKKKFFDYWKNWIKKNLLKPWAFFFHIICKKINQNF